jgi:hypothetical protein
LAAEVENPRQPKEAARRLLKGMSQAELTAALRDTVRRRGGKLSVRTPTGRLTTYGKRLARLRALKIESE